MIMTVKTIAAHVIIFFLGAIQIGGPWIMLFSPRAFAVVIQHMSHQPVANQFPCVTYAIIRFPAVITGRCRIGTNAARIGNTVHRRQDIRRNSKRITVIFWMIQIITHTHAGSDLRFPGICPIFLNHRINKLYQIANHDLGCIVANLPHIDRFDRIFYNFTIIIILNPFTGFFT